MAFDLATLLSNPQFQFGMNVLGGMNSDLQPLAQAMHAFNANQDRQKDQEYRDELMKMRREEEERQRAEQAAMVQARQAQAAAVKSTLAGYLQPPPDIPQTVPMGGGDRPLAFAPQDPVLPGGNWDMPTSYESDQMRVFKSIDALANVDPASALSMSKDIYSGNIPVPGMPGKPKRAPTLRDFQLPGGLQQTQQWDESAGAWNPLGQPVPRWKPDARSGGAAGGAGGTQPKKLTAEMQRKRDEINASRTAVARMLKEGGLTADGLREMAKGNPGLRLTLDRANQRLPGGDTMWEEYMIRQAQKKKSQDQIRSQRAADLRKQMGM